MKSTVLNDYSFGGGGVSLDNDGDCIAIGFTQKAHDCEEQVDSGSKVDLHGKHSALHGKQLGRGKPKTAPTMATRVDLRDLRDSRQGFNCNTGDGPGAVRAACALSLSRPALSRP